MFPDHDLFDVPDFSDVKFTKSKTIVYFHEDFIKHRTGNHPEHPRRLVVMREAVLNSPVNEKLEWVEPGLCEEADILRCHTSAHIETVKRAVEMTKDSPDGFARLDADTVVCSDSYRAACRAIQAGCEGADRILSGKVQSAWCLVRPPGHHSTPDRSMGFCLFNNAACAAEYVRVKHGLKKVMIIDYDLHHGNGTQEIFYTDPGVLYTSIHQSYHFPGTGYIDEIGEQEGRGYTVNFPVLAGSGDGEFSLYFREIVAPIALQFEPEILILSIGFDAHSADQLGFLKVSSEQFGKITTLLRAIATELNIGIVYTLEGGYSLEASAESLIECLNASVAEKFDPGNLPYPYRPSQGAIESVERLRNTFHGIWNI
ncbi:MAG: histone deacetylase [bacterium]